MKNNSAFETCHKFTARMEGGWSDNPHDRGGVTKYGCSLAFVRDVEKSEPELLDALGIGRPVSSGAIRDLTKKQAARLLKNRFWDSLNLDNYDPALAMCLYDGAVHSGCRQSVKWMQRALNRKREGAELLAVDGMLGPKTGEAMKSVGDVGKLDEICMAALDCRQTFLEGICERNPGQKVFRQGWLHRVAALRQYVRDELL